MTLCEADITTKTPTKIHSNFEIVLKNSVEERDQVRNFQPPITGEEICYFSILSLQKRNRMLKEIKEAILEGEILEYKAAYDFMLKKAKKIGLIKKYIRLRLTFVFLLRLFL
jgi:tRNA nucleotidyltransferase (CCA-adding enzyme)